MRKSEMALPCLQQKEKVTSPCPNNFHTVIQMKETHIFEEHFLLMVNNDTKAVESS